MIDGVMDEVVIDCLPDPRPPGAARTRAGGWGKFALAALVVRCLRPVGVE